MEFHLDHHVHLNQESEHKSLYTWSLQEISKAGEQMGSDQIPWLWNLYFSANELRYNKGLSIKREGNPEDILPTSEGVSITESISAVLQSGTTTANGIFEREATYSMFGTNRQIKDFSLIIRPLEGDDQKDICGIWGCVSYTSELDFRSETEDDVLQISIGISSERFNELRELVNHVRPDSFVIRLGRVSGFYSEWSPSVSTGRIKVLTRGSEHKIEMPEGCELEPPRLGEVGEFELTTVRRSPLQLQSEPDSWGEEVERDYLADDGAAESKQSQSRLVEHLAMNQAALDKLKLPMWLIVALLLLLYLK